MFGPLRRLILWAIRVVGYLLGVVGIFMIIASVIDVFPGGTNEYLISGIVMTVVGLIVVGFTRKRTEKIIARKMTRCSKCKNSLAGASYRYTYYRSKYNKVYHTIPVDFDITCPHCGKVNFKCESVDLYDPSASDSEIERTIVSWMNDQLEE